MEAGWSVRCLRGQSICRLAGLGVSAGNSVCYLYDDDDRLTTWLREEWCGEGASSCEIPKPGGGVWS